MSIIWLLVWLLSSTPVLHGDVILGLNAWGLALAICVIVDILGALE